MDFDVLIEQDEDGSYVAIVTEIERCYTQGKTIQEVLDRVKEAIKVCLETDKEPINQMGFIGVQRIHVEKPTISISC